MYEVLSTLTFFIDTLEIFDFDAVNPKTVANVDQ